MPDRSKYTHNPIIRDITILKKHQIHKKLIMEWSGNVLCPTTHVFPSVAPKQADCGIYGVAIARHLMI